MTSSEIEPATFRLVASSLNQLRYRVLLTFLQWQVVNESTGNRNLESLDMLHCQHFGPGRLASLSKRFEFRLLISECPLQNVDWRGLVGKETVCGLDYQGMNPDMYTLTRFKRVLKQTPCLPADP
jgi:hypothetical protein